MPGPTILFWVLAHPAHIHDLLFIRPTASMILFVPTKIGACLFIMLGFVVALHCVAFGAVLSTAAGVTTGRVLRVV